MKDSGRNRIYRLKTILLSVLTSAFGIGLLFLAKHVERSDALGWLRSWPVFELGSTLFITGALVIA